MNAEHSQVTANPHSKRTDIWRLLLLILPFQRKHKAELT